MIQKTIPVSVIITSYNYGHFLYEAVDSVLHQSCWPNEIIIIDDGSYDNTEEIGMFFCIKYPQYIKYVKNKKNLGISESFNKAVGISKSEYVVFLGADNKFHPTFLEETFHEITQNTEIGIVYTDFTLYGPLAKRTSMIFPKKWREKISDYRYAIHFPDFSEKTIPLFYKRNFIHGSSLLKKSAIKEAGFFRNPIHIPQDYDLFVRMVKCGWKARRVPRSLLEYRQHSQNQANSIFMLRKQIVLYKERYRDAHKQIKRMKQHRVYALYLFLKNVFPFIKKII